MEDVAQKITERLYGDDDKVKYEIILTILYFEQKFGGNINYYLEGNLDEYMKGIIEALKDNADLKKLDYKHARESDITASEFKKICECLEDENMLYIEDIEKLSKNQVKNAVEHFCKRMNE